MAELAGRQEQALTLQTRQLLLAVAESAPARSLSAAGCQTLLQKVLAASPQYQKLGILNNNRQIIASAQSLDGLSSNTTALRAGEPSPAEVAGPGRSRVILLAPHDERHVTPLASKGLIHAQLDPASPVSSARPQPELDGAAFLSQRPELRAQTSHLDPLFDRVLETHGFAVANVSTEPGSRTMAFGYPVLSPNGEPEAVAFAVIDCKDPFGDEIHPQLPKGANWCELDPQQNILFSYPEPKHRAQLMGRLGIHDVPGLVRFALRSGVIIQGP